MKGLVGRLRESLGLLAAQLPGAVQGLAYCLFFSSLCCTLEPWKQFPGKPWLEVLGLNFQHPDPPFQLSALPFLSLRWPSKTSKKELNNGLGLAWPVPTLHQAPFQALNGREQLLLTVASLEIAQRSPHPRHRCVLYIDSVLSS